MRTKEALKNAAWSFGTYFLLLLTGFISQRVFSDSLGKEYLGLHSLFTNLMTMLGIAEMGFGTAVISNMYKPVAEGDTRLIIALLQYYKRIYEIIAGVILGIGLCLLPFLKVIVGDNSLQVNLQLVFMLYLADTVASYFITYKRSVIYAYQKAYYTTIIHTLAVLGMNLIQIMILLTSGSFYWYLIIKLLARIIENILINVFANKKYPYILTKEKIALDLTVKQQIKNKVKGLLFHKIGGFAVFGADNIVISILPNLGLISVGIYSNYLLITNQLKTIISQIFSAITATVGNLLIEDEKQKAYETFKKLLLLNAWLDIYVSVSFYFVSFPFIEVWMGEGYVLDKATVKMMTAYLFLTGMRVAMGTFKEAAGIFYEDRYIPVAEAIINVVVSMLAGYFWGIAGVVFGTICSDLLLLLYSYPKYVYGKIFGVGYFRYIKDIGIYLVEFLLIFVMTERVLAVVKVDSLLTTVIINAMICFCISMPVLIICNFRKKEFKALCRVLQTLKKIMR